MNGHSDPNSILRSYTKSFFQMLCVSASVHCESMASRPLSTISKHLSSLLEDASMAASPHDNSADSEDQVSLYVYYSL